MRLEESVKMVLEGVKQHYYNNVHVYNTGEDKTRLKALIKDTAGKERWVFEFVKLADETSPFYNLKQAVAFANKHSELLKKEGYSAWMLDLKAQAKKAFG